MKTLEDRLHDTGEDLRRAATRVPSRALTHPRHIRRAAGWVGAAAAIGALIALPLWLSEGGTAPEGPPVGGESASTSSEVQPSLAPFGLDEAHIIIELAPGLSSEHAEGLVAELRQHPEVDAVLLVTRDEAVSEWLEILAATFGGDEASLQAAMAEVRASIRLLVHEATDRRAFGESLAAGLLRREGQPEPHPVVRVVVNTSDSRDADIIDASPGPEPQPVLELGPISNAEFEAAHGPIWPFVVEGSAILVAQREDSDYGPLHLVFFDSFNDDGLGDSKRCATAFGGVLADPDPHGKTLRLETGATCWPVADFPGHLGLTAGGTCVPGHEYHMLAIFGTTADGTATVILTDGRSLEVPILPNPSATLLAAWDGTGGVQRVVLHDGAASEQKRFDDLLAASPGLSAGCIND